LGTGELCAVSQEHNLPDPVLDLHQETHPRVSNFQGIEKMLRYLISRA
jgi:hypothetical protein